MPRYRKQNTQSRPLVSVYSNVSHQEGSTGDDVPSVESDAEFLQSNQSSVERQSDVKADAHVDIARLDDQKRDHLGNTALALLIVLHNGFYAFSFEIVVVSTCMLFPHAHFYMVPLIQLTTVTLCNFSQAF
jgi:hypothetical protein